MKDEKIWVVKSFFNESFISSAEAKCNAFLELASPHIIQMMPPCHSNLPDTITILFLISKKSYDQIDYERIKERVKEQREERKKQMEKVEGYNPREDLP